MRINEELESVNLTISCVVSISHTGQYIVSYVVVAFMSNSLVLPFDSIHTSAGSTYSFDCAAYVTEGIRLIVSAQ